MPTTKVQHYTFAAALPLWSKPLQDHFARPLISDTKKTHCNVTFICAYSEKVKWNGLAYLATMSSLFKARSDEEQHFVVLLPDYGAGIVRKLLLFISTGASICKTNEFHVLTDLAKHLGVSLNDFFQ